VRHVGVFALSVLLAACGASITPLPTTTPIAPVPTPTGVSSAAGTVENAPANNTAPNGASAATADNPTDDPADIPTVVSPVGKRDQTDQPVRVALATGQSAVRLSASGSWSLYDRTGENLLVRSGAGDVWTVESRDGMLRAVRDNGSPTASVRGPIVARPMDDRAILSYNGKRYRGEILVSATNDGLLVVNRLTVETYLRGVVPLEIGTDRTAVEEAAIEAQAIAARSYTYTRIDDRRPYDMTATVTDQVYGGVDAEREIANAAILATRDLVLMYNGRVINAPYHANSGGVTAAASEVWRTGDSPYLVSVSDRIPGSDHFYCEQSPKFRWTRTYDAATLSAVLDRYLRKYAGAPDGPLGAVQAITEVGHTQSGRVAGLMFQTDRGRYTVKGNDIRFVLRTLGGDVLPSTLFTIETTLDGEGRVSRVTISGTGNGHGVGMDQWGAIARARAGQNYRTILRTYYPGTTVARII
jgi:stage II sporulation protein D